MDQNVIQSIVNQVVLQLEKKKNSGKHPIPIAVSARHVHLSPEHLEKLFGVGYQFSKKTDLSQPGQFAAQETLLLVGPKGSIERVRILGPARGATQIEVSKTDAIKLGMDPPVRQSGDIKGSSPCTIVGPKGSIYITEGLIIAQCHIHMTPEDARNYQVKQGDMVQVTTQSRRPITFDQVLIRVSDRYKLEMHIDTDEANAALLSQNESGYVSNYSSNGEYHEISS